MPKQRVRDLGQQLCFDSCRGITVFHPHIDPVQKDRTAVPLPPESKQQRQGPGGQSGGHIGLKADLPHLQIGSDGEAGQLLGDGLIIMFDGVGDGQPGAVGPKGPALCQKGGESGVPLGKVGRPGVHHPQAEALYLLRPQAEAVPVPILVPVALQIGGFGQGVHRVGHRAP